MSNRRTRKCCPATVRNVDSSTGRGPRHTSAPSEARRSRSDFVLWGFELLKNSGHLNDAGFHLVVWTHDDWCPLHPAHPSAQIARQCQCQPDATLILNVGTADERRIEVIRDGISLARGCHA